MSGILHGVRRVLMPRGAVPTAPPAVTLILDAFTDVDTTALSAHTIAPTNVPATAWVDRKILLTATPSNAITSNQAVVTGQHAGAVVDAGKADVTITVDCVLAIAINRPNIIFRASADGELWYAELDDVAQDMSLFEVVGGTAVERTTAVSVTLIDGNTYALKVVTSGTSIDVYLDGALKLSHTSSVHQSNTQHGIGRRAGGNEVFDNFTVIG